jgi:hypothetical protein
MQGLMLFRAGIRVVPVELVTVREQNDTSTITLHDNAVQFALVDDLQFFTDIDLDAEVVKTLRQAGTATVVFASLVIGPSEDEHIPMYIDNTRAKVVMHPKSKYRVLVTDVLVKKSGHGFLGEDLCEATFTVDL